jgi:4-hydroxybenzoate polyprenyltransferase
MMQTSMFVTRIRDLLGLVKFSHTLFALPFALFGAALAAHGPDGWLGRPRDWLGILLCMATARSAAMAFNRLADRRLDALNPRTSMRHLPAGQLSVASVALFTAANAALFVAATLLFLPNRWPLLLAVPVLLWLLGYSYAKRFTSLAHGWLGASLALAPLAAWIALRGDVAWPPALLGLAVLFWVTGFDVIYACQDVGFDRARPWPCSSPTNISWCGLMTSPASISPSSRSTSPSAWACSPAAWPTCSSRRGPRNVEAVGPDAAGCRSLQF